VLHALLALPQLKGLAPERLAPWWERIARWRARDSLAFPDRQDLILPQQLMASLQQPAAAAMRSSPPTSASTRCGPRSTCASTRRGRWLTSGGAGTMGYGLPAAIGAQIAHPEATAVCVSGDASILMNIQELATARQHNARRSRSC
jgi:acetolactate synthase-1/2/3 large subunit